MKQMEKCRVEALRHGTVEAARQVEIGSPVACVVDSFSILLRQSAVAAFIGAEQYSHSYRYRYSNSYRYRYIRDSSQCCATGSTTCRNRYFIAMTSARCVWLISALCELFVRACVCVCVCGIYDHDLETRIAHSHCVATTVEIDADADAVRQRLTTPFLANTHWILPYHP